MQYTYTHTVHSTQYTVHSTQCTVHSAQYKDIVYSIQDTMQYTVVQNTVHIQYTGLHTVQHTVKYKGLHSTVHSTQTKKHKDTARRAKLDNSTPNTSPTLSTALSTPLPVPTPFHCTPLLLTPTLAADLQKALLTMMWA
jgi:hypothetical protein